jgi:aspartate/methionine/tyrosine aminotransferase
VCQVLTERAGVSAIPTSAFYGQEHRHITDCLARFCFAKTDETLDKAYRRIIYSGLSQMPV